LTLLAPAWVSATALPPTVLRVQGSNTIDATLGPALVVGLLRERGLSEIQVKPGSAANEQQVTAMDAQGAAIRIDLAAHGSSTGFSALQAGNADIAASSRSINPRERTALLSEGDLKSPGAEQVIGIDGIAIIVHPGNPLTTLSIEQLGQVFSGRVTRWEQLGAGEGPIHLFARDERSGTWETFKELVLDPHGETLKGSTRRLESSEQLSAQVSADPFAIGFIGLPYVLKAKALAIADGPAQPMLPTVSLIATEDYPLSRRLFFYVPPTTQNRWALALAHFAQSPAGQAIVAHSGFVAQTVQAIPVQSTERMPEPYRQLA
jgi:phosphate transport system substrate-binding protein